MSDETKPIPEAQIAEWRALHERQARGEIAFIEYGEALWHDRVIPALLSERESLLSLLREVEWVFDGDCSSECPVCKGERSTPENPPREPSYDESRRPKMMHRVGHAPDCRLAAFLGRGT